MAGLNIQEMHRAVRLGVQQVDANFLDGFLPEEIDMYINRSISEYIKLQQGLLKSDNPNQFEIASENLRTLIRHQSYTSFTDSSRIPMARKVSIPSSPVYDFFIHGHVVYNNEVRNCQWLTYARLSHFLATQNNPVPWYEEVPILLYDNEIHIMRERESDTISKFDFVYLREFVPVSLPNTVDCDLPAHTHEELIDRTVALIVTDVRQSRGQQAPAES